MIDRIALNGKMGTGKSTLAKQLSKLLGFEVISIGTDIKKVSTLLIENPIELRKFLNYKICDEVSSSELYNALQRLYLQNFKSVTWHKDSEGTLVKTDTYRDLLQVIGTEARNILGDNVWCEFAKDEALEISEKGIPVIIDDLRLPSEKEIFELNGFSVIRLDIEKEEQRRRLLSLYGEVNENLLNHPTEVALDSGYSFDLRFDTTNLSIVDTSKFLMDFIINDEINLVAN